MRKKKAIKQLQALGVQRNEAAGFIAAYRKIKAAGKLGQVPGIVEPIHRPPQFTSRPFDVRPFATTLRVPNVPDLILGDMMADADIHNRLARELGLGLLNAGAIAIHTRPVSPVARSPVEYMAAVEYTATVNVAMRRETA